MRLWNRTEEKAEAILAVMRDPNREWFGSDLARWAEIKFGTIYPSLAYLERNGQVTSRWQTPDEYLAGVRPRRRLYRLAS